MSAAALVQRIELDNGLTDGAVDMVGDATRARSFRCADRDTWWGFYRERVISV
jgi:hypothetical protein